ncbi:MAG: hypothetical protein IT380_04075 [Myxococcales bacterium]|nr:hypothetical protein [Myxococcales bacterium]
MSFPDFFGAVPRLVVHDALAELLGAGDGVIEYVYADAVRLAGHSCPTVAGAYLMTHRALGALFPEGRPARGGIRVELTAALVDGTAGVTASVVGLLTGAAGEGGFKGLGGQYARRDLLRFGAAFDGDLRFTRLDSGASAITTFSPGAVPMRPEMQALLPGIFSGTAGAVERREFGRLWQARVKQMLVDHFDDPALVVCRA